MRRWPALMACLLGCSSGGATHIVAAASPPKDDGRPAEGGNGGPEHAAALEQLKLSPLGERTDRQNSVRIPLPDANHWMRVKFWGIPTLLGFRYGQGHHAVVAGYVTHVEDNSQPEACSKSFESWAMPLIDAYDIDIQRDPPAATAWHASASDQTTHIVDIESVYAKAETLVEQGENAAAYGVYPAWKNACLIVGVAVPVRDGDSERAKEVRDRFAKEVLPKIEVISAEEPKERY